MNPISKRSYGVLPLAVAASFLFPFVAFAFNSGSNGGNDAFSPTVSTEVTLPASGVFNFTTVNIPSGVTVTFKKNTTNTPVVILASGDVNIAGAIVVDGTPATHVGTSGGGNVGDDGQPGLGGPGGYDGGRGGAISTVISERTGGYGLGPGRGGGGYYGGSTNIPYGGGGAGFALAGEYNVAWSWGYKSGHGNVANRGPVYGSAELLPLIGGSGGGGGSGNSNYMGSGGGGGGGAILIASSGTINVSGGIYARGGASGASAGSGGGGTGGGGSGGAIRLVATSITGNGALTATGGTRGSWNGSTSDWGSGGKGAAGRIRLEADSITRTADSSPTYSFGTPGPVFISGLPTLSITSVAGVSAPANPTGAGDIILPAETANPVAVTFQVTGVPDGNTIVLTVVPAYGTPISATSPAISAGTASVSIDLPTGPSVLSASTTYTIVAALGDILSNFAMGERVEKIRLGAALNGPSTLTLITVSGKEYELPSQIAAGILQG